MKVFILLLVLISSNSFAKDKKDLPSLGSCSAYTDYYIYKCQPFKCKLPVAKIAMTYLKMEAIKKTDQGCEYNYQYIIRDPKYPPAEIRMRCILSEKGALEMANQFTDYKKGNVGIYIDPPYSEILGKECNRY